MTETDGWHPIGCFPDQTGVWVIEYHAETDSFRRGWMHKDDIPVIEESQL